MRDYKIPKQLTSHTSFKKQASDKSKFRSIIRTKKYVELRLDKQVEITLDFPDNNSCHSFFL